MRAGREFDTGGHARGVYEQYEPPATGQRAIHDRTEELRMRLEAMAVGRTPQKCVQRSLVCDGCDKPIVPGEMMVQNGARWTHADSGCELAGEARRLDSGEPSTMRFERVTVGREAE